MNDGRQKVLIYRHQLFKPSEPFITEQTANLSRYKPVFVGRKLFSAAPAGFEVIDLQGASKAQNLSQALLKSPAFFIKRLRGSSPALIHAHFGVDAVYATNLSEALKIPLVVTLHGFDVTVKKSNFLKSGRPAFVHYVAGWKKVNKVAKKIICVSDFIKQKAVDFGFDERKLITHYIGVNCEKFTPGINPSELNLIHIARLVEKKGTLYLLEALAELKKRGRSGLSLNIVGEGPLLGELKEKAHALGLDKEVHFLGRQSHDETRRLLKNSFALCAPSVTAADGDAEGLPTVIPEAAASGVPVIATIHAGIPEAVVDGVSGLLVPERDVLRLADAIDQLINDRPLRDRLAARARENAVTSLNVAVQTQALESIYDEVLSQNYFHTK